MSNDQPIDVRGIRLSVLSPEISKKLNKFNTSSDGSLTLEEAIQGLIALQKQSNNYKRILYLIIPLLLITIASIFGVTLLAIKMTKETQIDSLNSSLRTMSNDLVHVGLEITSHDLFDIAWSPIQPGFLEYVSMNGTVLSVLDTYQTVVDNKYRTAITTQRLSMILDEQQPGFDVQVNPGFANDSVANDMKNAVFGWLNVNFDNIIITRNNDAVMNKMMRNSCIAGQFWCSTKKSCLLNGEVCPRPTTSKNASPVSAGSHSNKVLFKNPDPIETGLVIYNY
jgi:hypothetical protein